MGAPVLVGRQRELTVLAELFERTPPDSAVLLVLGEAGIGKSSLLREAESRGRARGFQALGLVGVETEVALAFAGLHQLLRPVLDQVALLPRSARETLSSAFEPIERPPQETFLIALAALDLLNTVADDGPVLVLADDVQWLDPQSHAVLAFVARRLAAPVIVIAVMRSGYEGPFLTCGFPELTVRGVDDEAADRILTDHAPDLRPEDRRRVLDEARGNPLALLELPNAIASAPAGGRRPPSLSDRLRRAIAGRLPQLPPGTRDALLVAAVDPGDDLAEILAATAVLGDDTVAPHVLAPAETAGLLNVAGGRVAFRHPLMRSAVLQAESLTRQQSAHRALAEVVTDPRRRTRHRANSIVGPDDRMADDLEAIAAEALRRGAEPAAITDLERSAQLTSRSAQRGRRLLMAAEHACGLGRLDLVNELLRTAVRTDLTDLDRARIEWFREVLNDRAPGENGRVDELCDIALRSVGAEDPDLALNLLLGAAARCWSFDTDPATRERVTTAVEAFPATAQDPRHIAALALADPVRRGREVMDALARTLPGDDSDALLLGVAAHAVGHETQAAQLFLRSEEVLRAHGRRAPLSEALSLRVLTQLALGDLEGTAGLAEEAGRLAEESGGPRWCTTALVCGALLKALTGDAPGALRLADRAEPEADRHALGDLAAWAQVARGVAALAAGRNGDAYRLLRRTFEPGDSGFHERERFTGLMFLADAAVRSGHRADARRLVAELERVAQVTPSPILHVHLSYARAVLASEEDAEDLYLAALRQDLSSWPHLHAKLESAYGSWLRRRGRHEAARSLLRTAQEAFDRTGALACGDEVRLELGAMGVPFAWPESASGRRRQIAELVGLRLSDDEISLRLDLPTAVVAMYRETR
ncbi:ATP-binding protein [Streptomyces sp. NPDC058256]|uniref:ATP-binding protein n=1 Tax=Streptomyces sp. NPDC058256 TaxID=3346408 RepID=UPI0036EF01A2